MVADVAGQASRSLRRSDGDIQTAQKATTPGSIEELKKQRVSLVTPSKAYSASVTICIENADAGACAAKAGACEWVLELAWTVYKAGFCRTSEQPTGVVKVTSSTPVRR